MASTGTTAPSVRAVLLDLSGTVHIGDTIVPGALEACQKLAQHNIIVKFLTNTTKSSRSELLEQLWKMGFSKDMVHSESLVTNSQAAKQVIQKHQLKPFCLVQDSLLQDLELAPTLEATDNDEDYNSVLIGLAPKAFNYDSLNRAFRVLMKEKERRKGETSVNRSDLPPLIIALHKGKYLRDIDGSLSLGPGGFVACLQEATGIHDSDIAVMGKPSRDFFHASLPEGILASETAMVGDDVRQDVVGALKAGLGIGILVKTGKYQEGDETVDASGCAPDIVADSLVEAVDYILVRNERRLAFVK